MADCGSVEIKQNKTTEHCQKEKKETLSEIKQGNIAKGKKDQDPGQYSKKQTQTLPWSKHAKTGQFKKIDNQAEGKTLF